MQDSTSKADGTAPVEQNLLDPKLRRTFSNRLSSQRSRQKQVKLVEELEERAKFLQDQVAQLQQRQALRQNQVHSLMVEEQTLLQEMERLQKKAMLRDDERTRKKKSRLEELRDIKQDQLLNLDINPQGAVSNAPPSYQGYGAQSSIIAPEARQMGIAPEVADRQEMMDQMNPAWPTAPNPNP